MVLLVYPIRFWRLKFLPMWLRVLHLCHLRLWFQDRVVRLLQQYPSVVNAWSTWLFPATIYDTSLESCLQGSIVTLYVEYVSVYVACEPLHQPLENRFLEIFLFSWRLVYGSLLHLKNGMLSLIIDQESLIFCKQQFQQCFVSLNESHKINNVKSLAQSLFADF